MGYAPVVACGEHPPGRSRASRPWSSTRPPQRRHRRLELPWHRRMEALVAWPLGEEGDTGNTGAESTSLAASLRQFSSSGGPCASPSSTCACVALPSLWDIDACSGGLLHPGGHRGKSGVPGGISSQRRHLGGGGADIDAGIGDFDASQAPTKRRPRHAKCGYRRPPVL